MKLCVTVLFDGDRAATKAVLRGRAVLMHKQALSNFGSYLKARRFHLCLLTHLSGKVEGISG